jgi:hypothetical protein
MDRSRGLQAIAGAMVAVVATAGAARAQSCLQAAPGLVRCRLLLSEAQTFEVRAEARSRPAAPSAHRPLALSVDGRPCREEGWAILDTPRVRYAACRVALTPASHVVEAVTDPADAEHVSVRLQPYGGLAALPREAATLYPRRHVQGWLRRLLPF